MEIEDPLDPEILACQMSQGMRSEEKEKGKEKLDRLKESNERMRLKVVTFEKKRKWNVAHLRWFIFLLSASRRCFGFARSE